MPVVDATAPRSTSSRRRPRRPPRPTGPSRRPRRLGRPPQAQDFDAYRAFYSAAFQPGRDASTADWKPGASVHQARSPAAHQAFRLGHNLTQQHRLRPAHSAGRYRDTVRETARLGEGGRPVEDRRRTVLAAPRPAATGQRGALSAPACRRRHATLASRTGHRFYNRPGQQIPPSPPQNHGLDFRANLSFCRSFFGWGARIDKPTIIVVAPTGDPDHATENASLPSARPSPPRPPFAAPAYWTDWTSTSAVASGVIGSLTVGSSTVGVNYRPPIS